MFVLCCSFGSSPRPIILLDPVLDTIGCQLSTYEIHDGKYSAAHTSHNLIDSSNHKLHSYKL